jgi:PAS domain S-box-containing protein
LFLLGLVALLPAFGLVLYTGIEQRQLAVQKAEREGLRIARLAASEQHTLIDGARQLLIGLAQLPAVRAWDARACSSLFADILARVPSYTNIAAATPQGDVFCWAVPPAAPVNVADRPHFRRAVETRDFAVGGYLIGRSTGTPNITLAYPLVDAAGMVHAVVFVGVNVAWLNHLAADALLPAGATLTVLDDNGLILARHPEAGPWVGKALPEEPMVRAILQRRSEGTVEATGLDGVPRVFAFTRLPAAPEAGNVYVSVGIPTAVIFAEANRILRRNLVGLGVTALLAFAAAWIASELLILRRVDALLDATERLTAGELGVRTGRRPGRGELSRLARTFDEMGAALRRRDAEARREAEAARQSRDTLRTVIDAAPVAIYAFDPEGRVTMWNHAAERMFGWAEHEVLGRPLPTVPPDRRAEFEVFFERARGGEALPGVEVRHQRKDGSPIDLLVSTAPLRDTAGGVQGFVSLSVDISDRRLAAERAEGLARVGRELIRTLDIHRVADILVSNVLTLLHVRSAALFTRESGTSRLVCLAAAGGTDRDRWIGRTLEPGQGVAGRALVEGEAVWAVDFLTDPRVEVPDWLRERARDEAYRAVLAIPLKVQDEVIGVLAVGDVAGRIFSEEDRQLLTAFGDQAVMALQNARLYQRAEARAEKLTALSTLTRLITSAAGTREVFQGVARAAVTLLGAKTARVWVADHTEGVLQMQGSFGLDPAVEQLATGFSSLPFGTGVIGAAFTSGTPEYIPDVQQEPRWKNQRLAIEGDLHGYAGLPLTTGDRVVGVLSILFGDRREFSDEDKELMRLLADQAAIAIEQARLFEELKVSYEDLQRTQAQLAQAQKMEAIGQLAGGIAHDFNNLLTVIGGRSQLLLSRLPAQSPVRRDLELIQKTSERAAALTRQLLAFSRKQILAPKVLDLNAVVSGMASMLQRLIGEDIDLAFRAGADLGRVKADPGQIEQVIVNLVVNARDAMPGGGRVTLETANVELGEQYARRHVGVQPGPYVMLAVSDTGTGMDAETQARIFEPFFTTKAPGKGTGLGLATVYGIVKQSGGNIWVYSEVGKGTTFKIYLPRVEETEESVQPEVALPGRGTETILLVEDEDEVRELAREILEAYGYTVFQARQPAEAMLIAERHPGPIHLLVTDVVMPEMSGRALAERLAPLRPEMKVLYMSGYTDNAIVHHGRLDAGTPFVQKPFTPDVLVRKVREVLESSDLA